MTNAHTTTSSTPAVVRPASRQPGRRGDARTTTAGHLVRVEHEHDEGLARCHNISDGGMAISAGIPLGLNDRVTVTIALAELTGRVAWINGRDCGIAFDQPIDSARILQNSPAGRTIEAARSPRQLTGVHDRVAYQRGACTALVGAGSMREVKVTNDSNFRPGLKVRVLLDNGFEKDGVLHWSQDNIAGVRLLEPVDVAQPGSSRRHGGRDRG